ncbi:unnamed protein product [Closterium sp. NIES-54]
MCLQSLLQSYRSRKSIIKQPTVQIPQEQPQPLFLHLSACLLLFHRQTKHPILPTNPSLHVLQPGLPLPQPNRIPTRCCRRQIRTYRSLISQVDARRHATCCCSRHRI